MKKKKLKLPPAVVELFRKAGSIGGKSGAAKRMEATTPNQRTAIAKKAAAARWAKKPAKGKV